MVSCVLTHVRFLNHTWRVSRRWNHQQPPILVMFQISKHQNFLAHGCWYPLSLYQKVVSRDSSINTELSWNWTFDHPKFNQYVLDNFRHNSHSWKSANSMMSSSVAKAQKNPNPSIALKLTILYQTYMISHIPMILIAHVSSKSRLD